MLNRSKGRFYRISYIVPLFNERGNDISLYGEVDNQDSTDSGVPWCIIFLKRRWYE